MRVVEYSGRFCRCILCETGEKGGQQKCEVQPVKLGASGATYRRLSSTANPPLAPLLTNTTLHYYSLPWECDPCTVGVTVVPGTCICLFRAKTLHAYGRPEARRPSTVLLLHTRYTSVTPSSSPRFQTNCPLCNLPSRIALPQLRHFVHTLCLEVPNPRHFIVLASQS